MKYHLRPTLVLCQYTMKHTLQQTSGEHFKVISLTKDCVSWLEEVTYLMNDRL